VPSSTYELQSYAATCKGIEVGCPDVSPTVAMVTRRSGDASTPFNPPSASAQPDGNDVIAVLNKFKNLPGAPSKLAAQIQPNIPELNADVSGLDISATVDAFKGAAYPFSGPCACPSTVTCETTACSSAAACSGGMCEKTCVGGTNDDQPCVSTAHCPGGGTCGTGFCRDRCGRCSP